MIWAFAIFTLQLFFLFPLLPLTTTLEGDASEILAALATNGVIHSPGFPAYMTFLKIFHEVLFFVDVPFVGALFSAVCAAGAGVVFFLILVFLGVYRPLAFAWSLLPLFCVEIWYQSQIAEVYSFAMLWLLLMIYFAIRNLQIPNLWQSLVLMFLSIGGFSAHVYVWPFIPLGLWFAWQPLRPPMTRQIIAKFGAAIILGLSFLLYLPIFAGRSRYVNEGDIVNWARFWDHISWKLHRERLSEYQEQGARDLSHWIEVKWSQFWFFLDQLKSQLNFNLLFWILILALLVFIGRRMHLRRSLDRSTQSVLASAVFVFLLIWIVFAGSEFRLAILGEMTVHMIPVYYLCLLFLGMALGKYSVQLQRVVLIGTLVFSSQHVLKNYGRMDLSTNRIAELHGEKLLRPLEPQALLLSQGDTDLMSIVFQQAVLGFRTDVQMINLVNGTVWYFDHLKKLGRSDVHWPSRYSPYFQIEIIEQNFDTHPIYFSNYYAALMVLDRPQIKHRFSVRPENGVYRLVSSRDMVMSRQHDSFEPLAIDDSRFALRGVEVDLIGHQKDYYLRRAHWEKSFSTEQATESVKRGLALPHYNSQFNQAIHLELLKLQQTL